MFLAIDFLLWGNRDLGSEIKFEPNFSDSQETRETGAEKDILLQTTRTVVGPVTTHEYTSSDGKKFIYNDCQKVSYKIALKKVENSGK